MAASGLGTSAMKKTLFICPWHLPAGLVCVVPEVYQRPRAVDHTHTHHQGFLQGVHTPCQDVHFGLSHTNKQMGWAEHPQELSFLFSIYLSVRAFYFPRTAFRGNQGLFSFPCCLPFPLSIPALRWAPRYTSYHDNSRNNVYLLYLPFIGGLPAALLLQGQLFSSLLSAQRPSALAHRGEEWK